MKKKNYIWLVALLTCSVFTQKGVAQESGQTYQRGLSIGMNAEAFMGLGPGYFQEFSLPGMPAYYFVKMRIPLLSLVKQKQLDTWEIEAGANIELVDRNRFLLVTDFSLFTARHKQSLGTFQPMGFTIKFTPACQTKKGYIGFQTMFNQVLFTHISHSDYVKESFNDIVDVNSAPIKIEPQNGFYLLTGNQLGYGLEGRVNFSDNMDLYFDLGLIHYFSKYTGFFDAMMFGQIPFYTNLQLNWSFNQR